MHVAVALELALPCLSDLACSVDEGAEMLIKHARTVELFAVRLRVPEVNVLIFDPDTLVPRSTVPMRWQAW